MSVFPIIICQGPGHSVAELKKLLQNEVNLRRMTEEEVKKLKDQLGQHSHSEVRFFTSTRSFSI